MLLFNSKRAETRAQAFFFYYFGRKSKNRPTCFDFGFFFHLGVYRKPYTNEHVKRASWKKPKSISWYARVSFNLEIFLKVPSLARSVPKPLLIWPVGALF